MSMKWVVLCSLLLLFGATIVGCEAPSSSMNPGTPGIRIAHWHIPDSGDRFAFRTEWLDSLKIQRDTNNDPIMGSSVDTLTFERMGRLQGGLPVEVLTRWTNGYKFYEYVTRDTNGDFWIADSGVGGSGRTRYPGLDPYTAKPNAAIDTAFAVLPTVIYGPPSTTFFFEKARYWCVGTEYFTLGGKSIATVVVRDSIISFDTIEAGNPPDTMISCHTNWFAPSLGCFVRLRTDLFESNKGVVGLRYFYQRELEAYKPRNPK
jgi:hypothetical protein